LAEYWAQVLIHAHLSVAITTTTKIYAKKPYTVIGDRIDTETFKEPLIRVGKTIEQGKLTGLTYEEIKDLGTQFDVVLIEADGAKGHSLKFPAPYEPVIPPFSEMIVVLSGLDSLFQKVDETVFRWELLCASENIKHDDTITPSLFSRFFSNHILLKGVDRTKCTIVLNKYDCVAWRSTVMDVAKEVVSRIPEAQVFITSLMYKMFYAICHE